MRRIWPRKSQEDKYLRTKNSLLKRLFLDQDEYVVDLLFWRILALFPAKDKFTVQYSDQRTRPMYSPLKGAISNAICRGENLRQKLREISYDLSQERNLKAALLGCAAAKSCCLAVPGAGEDASPYSRAAGRPACR